MAATSAIVDVEEILDLDFTQNLPENNVNDAIAPSLQSGDGLFPFLFLGNLDSVVGLPSANGSSPPSSTDQHGCIDPSALTDSSSVSSAPPFSPDSYLLPVNGMTLLRAVVGIATRLGCQSLWELDANSPFFLGTGTPADQLPTTWRPTTSQVLIPHHPVMDFLPWPGVRDRIITIMTLPENVRPEPAKGPLALLNFAYDFEDNAEGARIWGDDPYDAKSWEIGQLLFERWWFIFDREVIEQSNRWRRLRGAPALRLTSARSDSITGSVVDLSAGGS
jgi:Domain of unknown function (DUF3425)